MEIFFEMASPENSNWVLDYPLIDNISVTGGDFGVPGNGFFWTPQGINCTPSVRYFNFDLSCFLSYVHFRASDMRKIETFGFNIELISLGTRLVIEREYFVCQKKKVHFSRFT